MFRREWLKRLWFVAVVSVVSTLLSLAVPYVSKRLVDDALLAGDRAALLNAVLLFGALTVGSYMLNVWSGLKYTRISAAILFEMRLDVYRHLLALSPRFWARTKLGDVLSRLNNDISEVQRVAVETALAWIGNVLFVVGSVAMMLYLDARLFLVSLAAIPPSLIALHRYRARMEERSKAVRGASGAIGSFLIESLMGVRLVVLSNAAEREEERFRQRNDSFVDALMAMQRTSYFAGGLPGLMLSLGTCVVFLVGGWQVMDGALTLGTMVAFLAYHMRLMPPVQALMALSANLAAVQASIKRVDELMNEKPEVIEAADALPCANASGGIEFRDVSIAHDRGALLEHVSFQVAPGEIVAILGPSGSGKSTIADLLVRLLDPDSGSVMLDGQDLRGIRLSDLRRHIALVEQDPFLFHVSIAENLRYANPAATRQQLEAACEKAGIADFIATLPQGFETIAGERGLALSAGEKQRLALARAYLSEAKVLVLDEPTAALDAATEQRVIAGWERHGGSILIITHRLEVARRAHRTLVIEGNRLCIQ